MKCPYCKSGTKQYVISGTEFQRCKKCKALFDEEHPEPEYYEVNE